MSYITNINDTHVTLNIEESGTYGNDSYGWQCQPGAPGHPVGWSWPGAPPSPSAMSQFALNNAATYIPDGWTGGFGHELTDLTADTWYCCHVFHYGDGRSSDADALATILYFKTSLNGEGGETGTGGIGGGDPPPTPPAEDPDALIAVDGVTIPGLYVFDMAGGGWGKLDPDTFGVVTTVSMAEKDKDAYLVLGNSAGANIRVFDPANPPVDWEWRSQETTGAAYKLPGATFECTGIRVDWHRFSTASAGSVVATLFVDGVAMPALTIPEKSDRIWILGPRARGHRFSLDLVGTNAVMISARYYLAPGRV